MAEMTDINEVTAILRKFARACRAYEYLWGTSLPGVPTEVEAAVETAIEMIDRMDKMEAALKAAVRQNSHDMLMTGDELRQCEAALEESK